MSESTPLALVCRRCGLETFPRVEWQEFAGGKRHLRASCAACGGYIKFLPQTPENVALVVTRGAAEGRSA